MLQFQRVHTNGKMHKAQWSHLHDCTGQSTRSRTHQRKARPAALNAVFDKGRDGCSTSQLTSASPKPHMLSPSNPTLSGLRQSHQAMRQMLCFLSLMRRSSCN